jgi:hypothetical protein
MESKYIIIILVGVIIVLAAILGAIFLQSHENATTIEIKQTNLTVDDNLFSVNVLDSKGNVVSDVLVDLSIGDDEGNIIIAEEVQLGSEEANRFDYDLEKGHYVVKASFNGNEDYSGCSVAYDLNVSKVTPTISADELTATEYPKYNPDLGYYKSTGINGAEWAVVELADGRNVVIAGDGYYDYVGLESDGYPIIGTNNFLGHGGHKIV